MADLFTVCVECGESTAVRLGHLPDRALYACVACDAEFALPREGGPEAALT